MCLSLPTFNYSAGHPRPEQGRGQGRSSAGSGGHARCERTSTDSDAITCTRASRGKRFDSRAAAAHRRGSGSEGTRTRSWRQVHGVPTGARSANFQAHADSDRGPGQGRRGASFRAASPDRNDRNRLSDRGRHRVADAPVGVQSTGAGTVVFPGSVRDEYAVSRTDLVISGREPSSRHLQGCR